MHAHLTDILKLDRFRLNRFVFMKITIDLVKKTSSASVQKKPQTSMQADHDNCKQTSALDFDFQIIARGKSDVKA